MHSPSGSLRLGASRCSVPRAVWCSRQRNARGWSKGEGGGISYEPGQPHPGTESFIGRGRACLPCPLARSSGSCSAHPGRMGSPTESRNFTAAQAYALCRCTCPQCVLESSWTILGFLRNTCSCRAQHEHGLRTYPSYVKNQEEAKVASVPRIPTPSPGTALAIE